LNEPNRDQGGARVVPQRFGHRVSTPSSSFGLSLGIPLTSPATNWINGIPSTICFVSRPSRAPKCARCFGIRHVLLLPHLDHSSRCVIPSALFGEFEMSFESLQRELSNEPRRKPGGVLDVPLRVELPFGALSSSFCLLLGLFSTSSDTEYISGISSTIRFDWRRSQVSKCARCLGTHHVLLPHFCLLPCCFAS